MKIERLQYITQSDTEIDILQEVETVIKADVLWVQLRIKSPHLAFETIAQKLKEICKNKAAFIINDRVDIAKNVDADGVHLGLEDMPIEEARHILGKNKIIGGTSNSLKDCIKNQMAGVDYIGLGPFGYTKTKKKLSPILGLESYVKILSNEDLKVPIFAVGGVNYQDIKDLKQRSKIWGVAVSSLIKNSDNKADLVKNIKQVLENG